LASCDGILRAEIYNEDICGIQRRVITANTPSEDEMNEWQMCACTQEGISVYSFAAQPARSDAAIDAIIADMDRFTEYCRDFILEESVEEMAANDIQRCLENRETLVHLVFPKACEYTPEHESLLELIEADCSAHHKRRLSILGRDNRNDNDSDDYKNDYDDNYDDGDLFDFDQPYYRDL